MKLLLLPALLLNVVLDAVAQQPTCKTVHTGTYRMTSRGGITTLITRTGKRQTELMSNSSHQTAYAVEWLDDCTYVLIPEASFFAKYPMAPRDARLTVHITATSSKGYSIATASNFSADVFRGEVARVR